MKKIYQLPKEFASKWVDALKSGNFKQTKDKLKDDCGYCCLGVACVIEGNGDKIYGSLYPNKTILPIAGFYADFDEESLYLKVSAMNDTGSTFSEIADWVKENVEFI